MRTNDFPFAGLREPADEAVRMEIRDGRIIHWAGQDKPSRDFDYVQGRLTGISYRKKGSATFLDLHFIYGDTRFDVSTPASYTITAELVSKLANIRDLASTVRIDVWPKDSFTNCMVREDGRKLPYRSLPGVSRNGAGADTTARDAAVKLMVDELNARLTAEAE